MLNTNNRQDHIVMGIDPSLNRTGWAVIKVSGSNFSIVDCGEISSKNALDDYIEKVANIGQQILNKITEHKIEVVAMEKTVCNVNPGSSLKLGMVRGAVIFAAKTKGASVTEYEPKKIKGALVGNGNASKDQVAFMVRQIVGQQAQQYIKNNDITDALATAIAHYNISTSLINGIGYK